MHPSADTWYHFFLLFLKHVLRSGQPNAESQQLFRMKKEKMVSLEETKGPIRGIIDSYEMRVKTVSGLMSQTIQVLKNYQQQQEKMTQELKNILAKTESLRKRDFDKIMEEMWGQRRKREKEIHQTLEIFLIEEKEMIDELRKLVNSEEVVKVKDFIVLKERILNHQRQREKRVSEILRSFHLEQEELSIVLKKLLLKGKRVKIKQFKNMVKGLQAHRIHKESGLGKALDELEMVDREVNTAWHRVMMSTRKV